MKRNKIMFVIAIVAILAVLFVACDEGTQPEHTHTYGAWTVTTAPTEGTAGSATRACACGDVQTTTVAKLSDTSVWTVTVSQDATHETAGFKAYKSADFGTFTVTVPKGEHAYGAWEISKEPTETETGIARKYCACGHYDEAVLAVLTNTTVWTKTAEGATHQAPGREIYTSEYGVVTIVTDAIQHVYGEWASNNDGTHSRVCACGDRQTEQCVYNQRVDAPAFLKSAATCTSKAVYYLSCVCGAHSTATFESGTALGHDYYNFQVKSEPTCTEAGQVVADCRRCDQKYDGAIPALGHDHDGGCIPYENITLGEDHEDGSNYHIYICSRCGEQDKEHKEKHTFGEKYFLDLDNGDVVRRDNCTACGYVRKDIESYGDGYEFEVAYGKLSDWTVTETVSADYNQAGYTIYTYQGYTYRKETAKLIAPYVGTTYYAIEVETAENGGAVSLTDLTSARATFDANGKATGEAFPFRGENTIRITDATTGALTYTRVNSTSTYNETGCIDLENGVIVHTNNGSNSDLIVMFPTSMTVTAKDVTGSTWTDSMAFAYNAKCNLNETHLFNVFVYEGNVYFDAQFVDADGNAVAAGACSEAPYVKVLDAEGNKVQAFAQKNGGLTVTDGKEGTYTNVDNTLKFDGVGGFVLNGKSGFYTVAAEDASYGYDAYVGADVATATEYYQITLGENNTCTVVKPEATLSFGGEGVVDVANITANVNIVTTLPTPVREGYVFNGWQLNGAGNAVTTFVAPEAGKEYLFEAQWTKRTTVTVRDLKDEDKAQYSTAYVGVGNPFVGVLPAYDENTYRDGYKFEGWYLDDGDDVLNTEKDKPLGGTDTAETEGADYVIFAVWVWQGNVTFAEQTGYTFVYDAENGYWKSNNKGKNSSNAVMEFQATEGIVNVSFEYYVSCESSYSHNADYLEIYYGPNWKRIVLDGTSNEWTSLTTTLTFNVSGNSNQKIRITYHKDSSANRGEDTAYIRNLTINGVAMTAQSSLNKNAGTYTLEGAEDIKVSAGGTVTIGENTYLTSTVSENVIGVMVGDVYKEYTLDTAAKTYTVVEPKVTVAYNYKGHGTNTSAQVGKYSNQTLSTEVPTAEGFVFRGWYTDEALTKAASKTFVASEDVTFYAKWDAAITLTYNYLNGGANANVVVNLYANDKVATLQKVDFDWEGKKFAGWFTKDGSADGDWGDEFKANTALTANTTVYAKWVTPHFMMGSYKGYNVYNNVYASSSTLTVDMYGTGISDYNAETGYFNFNGKYAYYDAVNKMIVRGGKYADKSFGTDVYYYFLADSVSVTKSDIVSWNGNKSRLIPFVIGGAENATIVFINDNEVYAGAAWTAVDENGADVSGLANVASNAKYLTVTCGGKVYEYGKKSGSFVALDGYQGTYTSGEYSVTLDGLGNITGVLEGTYTKAADDAGYTFDVKTTSKEAYKLTVNKEDSTCTYETNTVKFTYVNDKKAVSEDTVFVGIQFTLPSGDAVAVEGYIFRGWYTDDTYTTKVTTVTPSVAATYYAKYDKAVTLTFDYSGYAYNEAGETTQVVTGKYINDTLGNIIPTVASDVRHEGKAFVGWFFKDGENWGDQVSSSTALTQEVVTIYARWIDPAAAMGTYNAWNLYGSTEGGTKTSSDWSTSLLTVNADGSYTGKDLTAGKLTADQMQLTDGVLLLNNGKTYHYINATLGLVWRAFGTSSSTSVNNDTYIGINTDKVTSVDYSGCKGAEGEYIAFFKLTYKDGSVKYAFLYNSKIVEVSGFRDASGNADLDVKEIKATSVLVYGVSGKVYAKVENKIVVGNDGKGGSYNGTELGEVVLNGFGALTVDGQNVAYTLNADKTQATFVLNNQLRVIALGNGTYTLALDGYQGTYTLPDGSPLELDGHGNAGTGTYVVNGANITIYNSEASTKYGLDVESKKLLGKSVFAGLTFSGSYKDQSNDPMSFKIVFDDSPTISGYFSTNNDGLWVRFTGELTGTTLTLTMLPENSISWNKGNPWKSDSSFDGKVVVLTVDGDTLKVTSTTISNSAYTFKEGTAKCEGFSL